MAEEKNEIIKKARVEMNYLTGEEAERRLQWLREKWEMDYNSDMRQAKREGRKEGNKDQRGDEYGAQRPSCRDSEDPSSASENHAFRGDIRARRSADGLRDRDRGRRCLRCFGRTGQLPGENCRTQRLRVLPVLPEQIAEAGRIRRFERKGDTGRRYSPHPRHRIRISGVNI